ncbi:MAG TPA: dihydrolipoamide acetyltransferase family protein [Stellaceae bacterium]|nr:dihydrolipoamide acetyltransferase family protein [Stellaceae bacterium]
MPVDVIMPQMGESVVEGTVSKWLINVGDKVQEDQPLVEISTDKVDAEIPSPAAGVITKIIASEGQTLPVGALLAVIDEAGKAAAPTAPRPAPEKAAAPPPPKPSPQPAPQPPPAERPARPVEAAQAASAPASAARLSAPLQPRDGNGGQPARFSPVVMKMAAEYNIDVGAIRGTGLGGRVTKRDVISYMESAKQGASATGAARTAPPSPSRAAGAAPAVAGAAPAAPGIIPRQFLYEPREGDQVEPFSRRRKLIAEHMVYSKTHSPHVGTVAEVDMTRAAQWRDKNKAAFQARHGFGLTFLPMVAMAAVRALKEFPRMNAAVTGDSLVIRKDINLGIAVDTEEGLVVPVIKQADQKSLVGLAAQIDDFARRAADRKITADDLAGGSFTLTNPGREGNLFGIAIINQPQIGILRMGEIKKRPVVIEVDGADAIAIHSIMYLTLSYDHRVVDGVLGNRFLFRVARLLEAADFEL